MAKLNLLEVLQSFDLIKALKKAALGGVATGMAYLSAHPDVITRNLPEFLITAGLGGLIVEVIDFLGKLAEKAKENA